MRTLMPEELKNADIILNLGDSSATNGYDYNWINEPEAVRNASNKRRMFELFEENEIKCITRVNGHFVQYFISRITRNGITTIRENKVKEYRVIVYNGRMMKVMEKVPKNGDFILKLENCDYQRVERFVIPKEDRRNIIRAVECLGLDLAGVDVLKNDKGEFKVIEVNSGPGMGEKNIGLLFRRIMEEYGYD